MDILFKIQSVGNLLKELLNKQTNNRDSEKLYSRILEAKSFNHWFTEDAVILRLHQIRNFLTSDEFNSAYSIFTKNKFKKGRIIGVHSEENIPLEEFADLLGILISGNSFIYKTNEKSDKLILYLFELIGKHIPELSQQINFFDGKIKNYDFLFFTQRENANTVLKKYLNKDKSFIEVRHQSVAVLDGNENAEVLKLLGNDVFSFFGMGCGNVRKIYIPKNYDLTIIFKAFEERHSIIDHSAYANNYQYYQSVYLLNCIPHFDNGFLLFKEDTELRSPTGVMYYEYYEDKRVLLETLHDSLNISVIYTSNPVHEKEKMLGESINQLLFPSENLINFLQ